MSLLTCILGCLFMIEAIGGGAVENVDETKDSKDAWRTITHMGKDEYLLMLRSSEYDGRLGSVANYVYMRLCEYNYSTQTAMIRFMHKDSSSAFLVGLTQRATVPRSPKNETSIIRFSNADSCNQGTDNSIAEYKVLYSNYESCFVLNLLSTEEKRCELWVKEGFEVQFENEFHKQSTDVENGQVDDEADPVRTTGGLGHCVRTYCEKCGHLQYKIYKKEMCSLSSIMKETNTAVTR
uniref:Putative salivary lipocalin n=1 Tax=Ixodes ricinus TaxID=34613 RepID=A0A0K8R844_IXORI